MFRKKKVRGEWTHPVARARESIAACHLHCCESEGVTSYEGVSPSRSANADNNLDVLYGDEKTVLRLGLRLILQGAAYRPSCPAG